MIPVRFTIRHYMILSALVALALAAWQFDPARPVLFFRRFAVIVPVAGMALAVAFLCWSFPLHTVLANPPADPDQHIAALERALASAWIGDVNTLARARLILMALYKLRQRYDDAIAQGRTILRMSRLTLAFEADVHLEIADCLDVLGRGEEATTERLRADETLDDRPDGALGWLVQGKLLDKQLRYAEAIEAFERARGLFPAADVAIQNDLRLRLCLASYNAGRTEDVMRWAEPMLAGESPLPLQILAHRLTGVALVDLCRLDEGQRHHQRAFDLATRTGEAKTVADCLASLANVQRSRGDLAKAEALCDEAMAMTPAPTREPLVAHATILHAQGRIDAAILALEQALRASLPDAYFERRMQAILKVVIAQYKLELGRLDEARADVWDASPVLGSDPKLGKFVEAAAIRLLLKSEGASEANTRRADHLLEVLGGPGTDSCTRRDCLDVLGRGFFEAGRYERSRDCWQSLLQSDHSPLLDPVGWYHVGECHRHLGEETRAREAFAKAIASEIDCEPARLAAQRVQMLGAGSP